MSVGLSPRCSFHRKNPPVQREYARTVHLRPSHFDIWNMWSCGPSVHGRSGQTNRHDQVNNVFIFLREADIFIVILMKSLPLLHFYWSALKSSPSILLHRAAHPLRCEETNHTHFICIPSGVIQVFNIFTCSTCTLRGRGSRTGVHFSKWKIKPFLPLSVSKRSDQSSSLLFVYYPA